MHAYVRAHTYGRTYVRTYVRTFVRTYVRKMNWKKTKQLRKAHNKHQHDAHNLSKKSPKPSKIESSGLQNRAPGASKRFLGTKMASETLWGSTRMVFLCYFDQFWSPKLVQNLKKNEATKHIDFLPMFDGFSLILRRFPEAFCGPTERQKWASRLDKTLVFTFLASLKLVRKTCGEQIANKWVF